MLLPLALLSPHRQRTPQKIATLSELSVSEEKDDLPWLDVARYMCLHDSRAKTHLDTTVPEIPFSH